MVARFQGLALMSSENGAGTGPKLRFPEFAAHALHDLQLGDLTEEPSERNKAGLGRNLVMGVKKDDGIVPMEQRLIAKDITRYKTVKKDWFAYNPMRLNIGSISRWQGDNDVLVSPDYVVFCCRSRVEPTPLLPAYLDHYRASATWDAYVRGSGDGSVRTRIYYDDVAQLPMRLPDIAEQQKIAESLSSLDAVIAVEGDRLKALKDHKKGLMQALFPAPGQTTPRLRFPEFRDTEEWEEKTLGEIIHTVTPPKKLQTTQYGSSGRFPIIDQSQDLVAGWTNDADALIADGFPFIVFGDHTCVLKLVSEPFAQGADGIKIMLTNHEASIEFVYQSLLNNPMQTEDYKRHFSKLKERRISYPSRITGEQDRIVDCLSSFDDAVRATSDMVVALKLHKAALMQLLFPTPDVSV